MAADLKGLTPDAERRLRLALAEANQRGIRFTVTSGYRSPERQRQLWENRASNPFPVAPPGTSTHERGTAADVALASEADRDSFNEIMARHGWGWPHGKKDRVHYEFGAKSADPFRQQQEESLASAADQFIARQKRQSALDTEADAFIQGRARKRADALSVEADAFIQGRAKKTPAPSQPRTGAGLQTRLAPEQIRAAVAADPRFADQAKVLADSRLRRQGIDPADVERRRKLGGLFPEGGDTGGSLETFAKATTKVDDAANAALASVARDVRQKGVGALVSGATYSKAGKAGEQAALDLKHETPPTAVRELFGLEKGKAGRAAYNTAATADYILAGLIAPSNLMVGPLFEGGAGIVKAGVKGVGKLALREAEKRAPKAAAAVTRAVVAGAEKFGVGPAARAGRAVGKEYRIDLESRIQDAGQIVRELRDLTVRTRKKSAAFDQAERAYAGETGGQSRLQSWVYEYATRDSGGAAARATHDAATDYGLRQAAKKFGLPYQEAKALGDRLVAHANETIARLEKAGAVKPGALSSPGPDREQFLRGYAEQLFSRPAGSKLGETGSTAFAGSNIKAVRKAAVSDLTERLASDTRYTAPVVKGEPLRPGWAAVPDDAAFGKLRGLQAPAPVVRLIEAEAKHGLPKAAGDDVARAGRQLGNLWRKVVGGVKVGYISNPGTLFMNVGSNVVAAEIGARRNGVNPARILQAMPGAVKEVVGYLRTGRMSTDIAEFSRYSTAFLNSQAAQAGVASAKTAADLAGTGGRVFRLGTSGPSVYLPPARELGAKALGSIASLHGASEQASKIALFKALKPKLGAKRAAEVVEQHLFDYSDRNALLEMLDRNGLWIFNSFPVKATELLFDTLTTRPDLVARYPRVARLLRQEMGAEKDYQNLPENRKGPLTIPLGGGRFVDANRAFPFKDALSLPESVGRIARQGLSEDDLRAVAGRALPAAAAGIAFNRNVLTGREIVKPGTPPDVANAARRDAFIQSYGPPLLTRTLPGLAAAAQGRPAKPGQYSEAQPLGEAILQYGLGLPTVRSESLLQKARRLGDDIDTREAMADSWIDTVEREIAKGTIPIPKDYRERAAGHSNPAMLHKLVEDANKRLRELRTDATLYANDGQLTDEGRAKLRRFVQWRRALMERFAALPPRQ